MPRITGRTIIKLLVASLLLGFVLTKFNVGPLDLLTNFRNFVADLIEYAKSFFSWAFSYVLIGAVVVVPIWLVAYLWKAARNRG